MRQFSAAVLSRALGAVQALLAPSRGRHSAAALRRRRRSTRVRRYAPLPDAPALLRAVPEHPSPPERPAPAHSAPPAHSAHAALPGRTEPRPLPSAGRAPVQPTSASADPLSTPSVFTTAEDVALVRPYYEAHERELALVQARAADRLERWTRIRSAAARPGGPTVGTSVGPAVGPVAGRTPGTPVGVPGTATHRVPAARCEYRGVPA